MMKTGADSRESAPVLLFRSLTGEESEDTVNHKQNACDENHDAECVAKGKHQTDALHVFGEECCETVDKK